MDLSLAVTAVENLNASMSDLLGTIVKAITNRVPQIISYVGGVASGVVTILQQLPAVSTSSCRRISCSATRGY